MITDRKKRNVCRESAKRSFW